jgi:sRNA-binding regulator protein Hfq
MTAVDTVFDPNATIILNYILNYIERGQRKFGDRFDPSDLLATQHFAQYAPHRGRKSKRIKVLMINGNQLTGVVKYVDRVKPYFVLQLRKNYPDAKLILLPTDNVVAVRDKNYHYQPVA